MKKLLKIELKKAICSKFFLLGLSLLMIFAIFSAMYMVENWSAYNPGYINERYVNIDGSFKANPDIALFSFYKAWLGADTLSIAAMVFFKIVPIAAAIPYGWTFCREYKSGYLKNIACRTDKKKYILAKSTAVFISGALVVLLPMIINIMVTSALIPAPAPYVSDTYYTYTSFGYMWSDIFFDQPALYVALYVIFDAFYGGIFALLSFAVSFYVKNVFITLFSPFLICLGLGYLNSNIWSNFPMRVERSVCPMDFLPALQGGVTVWWIVLIVTAVLLLFIFGTVFIKGYRDEIL